MRYQLTPIHCPPWTVSYLSVKLIESHYEMDYGANARAYVDTFMRNIEGARLRREVRHGRPLGVEGNGNPDQAVFPGVITVQVWRWH